MKDFQINTNECLPLWDVVFQTLRKAILMGELEPGERLMELQLTKKLGVSRTPVREAIRKLELEGLVTMAPRKGATVAYITQKDFQDVLEVRCSLEELAVGLACERITDKQLQELENSIEEFRSSLQETDITLLAKKDVEFHDLIFHATDNRQLLQMLGSMREQMYRYRLEHLKNPDIHPQLLREHETIFDSLQKRNKMEAQAAIRIHITNQIQTVSRNIETTKPKQGSCQM